MLTFKEYIIETVSKKTLEHFHNGAINHARSVWGGKGTNCAGTCLSAAYALHKHLKSKGKDSHLVLGSYNKKGKHPTKFDKFNSHAWVVHNNKILDVTHNQFDRKNPIITTKHNDIRYKEHTRKEKEILHRSKEYDKEFQPSEENLKHYAFDKNK
jgi:hypothetical protein